MKKIIKQKEIKFEYLTFFVLFVLLFFVFITSAEAQINEKISYQGKLTNNLDVAVADGGYNMRYKLCSDSDCSTVLWTETHCYSPDDGSTCDGTGADQRVLVSKGIFSVLLGEITVLSSVNFDQTLYLEVQVGGSSTTPSWQTLTPRKMLGSAPSAFEAKQLDGKTWTAPGTIGSGTPNTGAFTTLSSNSTTTLATTAGSTFGLGNSTGAGTIASGGVSSWTNTSGNLTISTATSGILALTSAQALNLTGGAASYFNTSSGDLSFQIAGTGTGNVQIGDGGTTSATPDLLVLDIGSAEPTGAIGSMYYSTALNKFRCYQESGWTDCIGTGGAGPWTDGSGITYLTDTAENFAVGGSALNSPFSVEVSSNTVRIGDADTSNNAILAMYGKDGDAGTITYTDNDSWDFEGGNVGIGTANPTAKLYVQSTADSASLGDEIITNVTFTGNANGWTLGLGGGNPDWYYNTNKVSHADGGGTAALEPSTPLTVTAGSSYLVSFDLTGYSAGSVTASIGGTDGQTISYGVTAFSQVIVATNTDNLKITPTTTFIGNIDNVSVKLITIAPALMILANSDSTSPVEFRSGGGNDYNTFIGNGSGQNNTIGNNNSAMGYTALNSNTVGSKNSASGAEALYSNTTGSVNTAVGVDALYSNTTGWDNSAMGVEALYSNTTGFFNSAMGVGALTSNTTGGENSAMGYDALFSNTTGIRNSAMGSYAGGSITTGSSNTFLGYYSGYNALQKADAQNSMALGNGAYTTADNQVVIGNTSVTQTLLNGYVGIGDTTPDSLLDILSSATANTYLKIANTDATNTYDSAIQFELDAEGTVKFTMGVDNNDSEKFKISTTALGTNDRLVIDASALTFANSTSTDDTLGFLITTGGAGRFAGTLTNDELTGNHSWILPNVDGTVALAATTLAGYGITDALSNSASSTQSGYFGDIYMYDDGTPSHYLQITNSGNLTDTHSLSLNTNNADRTVSLSGDLTVSSAANVSNTNTGDQFTSETASTLIGRGSAGGAGAAQEITLGTNLSMSGTTLNATGGGGTLQSAYDASSGNTILATTGRNIAFTLGEVAAPASFTVENQDTAGTSAEYIKNSITSGTLANGLLIEQTGAGGTITDAIKILETAGAITTGLNIGNNVATGISIGTSVTTGISVGSGGITITAGALAVNSDSITSDGTLVIDANGNVNIQDILNADSITTDTNGVTIAANASYSGLGTVTLSSAAASALTINSGTIGTIAIGDDGSAETINIGTGAAAKTLVIGSTNTTSTTTVQSGSNHINLQANSSSTGNVQIGDGGATSATPDMLVLDIGSADPAGTNGAMFYSTATNTFRCYENSAWKNCDTTNSAGLTVVEKDADEPITSDSTLSNDSALVFTASASTAYVVELFVRYTSSAAADFKYTLITPSGLLRAGGDTYDAAGTTGALGDHCNINASGTVCTAVGTAAHDWHLHIYGIVEVGASGGTVAFQWAQNSSDASTTQVEKNSILRYTTLAGAADLAEVYFTNQPGINSGDVVSIDPDLESGVKKSESAYDKNILGIVSEKPALLIGDAGNEGLPVSVALSGRVPVKVSAENGPIYPGDYITASSKPGIAMKATKAGAVIGQALTSYAYNGEETGKVVVFIKNFYYPGSDLADLFSGQKDNEEELAGLQVQGDLTKENESINTLYSELSAQRDLIAELNRQIEGLKQLANQELSIAQIDASKQDIDYLKLLLGIDRVASAGDVSILGKLEADEIVAGAFAVRNNESLGETIGEGKISLVSKDENNDGIDDETKSDGKSARVKSKAVTGRSKIFVTAQSEKALNVPLTITEIDEGEFVVEVLEPAKKEIIFDWWIVNAE